MANEKHTSRRYHKNDAGEILKSYSVRISTLGALAIIASDLALIYYFASIQNFFLAIATVGIVTFIGILALANYVSIDPRISTGEMRSAITASIIVVYLVVIAFSFTDEKNISETAKTVIQHFTWVVGVVVIFYFGSKGVLQYLEAKNKTDTNTAPK